MNTETGAIYRTEEEIAAARARGEQLAMVSERVAAAQELGQLVLDNQARRRQWRARWYGTSSPKPDEHAP